MVATYGTWLSFVLISGLILAAVSQSMPIVTAYDTLGEEGLTHSLQETAAVAIFLDGHLIKSIVKPLSKAKDIKVRDYFAPA
jgi:long-subunit acyl-CoA synthetase (AMP-forming)